MLMDRSMYRLERQMDNFKEETKQRWTFQMLQPEEKTDEEQEILVKLERAKSEITSLFDTQINTIQRRMTRKMRSPSVTAQGAAQEATSSRNRPDRTWRRLWIRMTTIGW
jgi:hypothetical protein